MKTLTKTIIGYPFNELDEFAYEKAKSSVVQKERLPDFFSKDLTETLKEKFGLRHLKTYYSLSNNQGDGLCLVGKIIYAELFDNHRFRKIAFKGIHHKQIISVFEVLQNIDFIHNGMYYHPYSVCVKSHECEPTDRQMAIIEKIVKNVKSWYFAFCKEWEQLGYEYFYTISNEDMEMICEEYDYMFTEEGALIDTNDFLEFNLNQ